jgi:hypothetical protein
MEGISKDTPCKACSERFDSFDSLRRHLKGAICTQWNERKKAAEVDERKKEKDVYKL